MITKLQQNTVRHISTIRTGTNVRYKIGYSGILHEYSYMVDEVIMNRETRELYISTIYVSKKDLIFHVKREICFIPNAAE